MQPIIFSPFTYLFAIWRRPMPHISLNLAALVIVLGILPLLFLAELPRQKVIQYLIFLAFCLLFFPYKTTRLISLGLLAFILGCWHAHQILSEITYFSETSRTATVMVDSVSLESITNETKENDKKARYRIRLIESNGKYIFPALYASVSWDSQELLCAGQKWQVTMKLRPVHAQLNQGSYDSQRYLLSIRQPLNGKIIKAKPLNRNCNLRQDFINKLLPEIQPLKQSGIALALAFGERAWLDKSTRLLLQQTGIAHLMAISGLHIAMASLFGWCFARIMQFFFPAKWIGFRFPLIMGWLMAILYGWLSGWGIPAVRAILGLTLWIYLRCKSQLCFSWQWALWSAALILFFDPLAILSDSFWLSFTAVMALLFWFHWMPLPARIRYGWRWAWLRGLHMQLGLMLMLLPLQLLLFQGVNIASLVANLWAVPIISFVSVPLIMLGIVGIFLPVIQPFLWQLVDYSVLFALAPLPALMHSWFETGHYPIVMTLAGWFFVVIWRFRWWRSYQWLLGICIGIIACYAKRSNDYQWRFSMLDVGHGLAVVVDKGGKAIIFDTGNRWETGSMAEKVIEPYLRWHRLTPGQIILSHDHLDHTGGMEYLMEKYPDVQIRSPSLNQAHLPCVRGEQWIWKGLNFEVLWPPEKTAIVGNNQSCVIRIDDGKHSLLLTGDLEKQGEYRLAELEKDYLHATVLQVPHHGSNTSSTSVFIRRVMPQYALASVARYSPWRLPSVKVKQRYKKAGVEWQSTAVSGQITGYFYRDHIKLEGYRQQIVSRWYHQWFGNRGDHE
ncbi:putative recombination protein with metallo-hydrolase domain [Xenorhabdus doucetiae]|uniref:Competence protein ComEC n=2 Tax=Xenorhabdus doucetiae TaxID=351671 RepID=A0A068QTY1_9GAMM|nr:competence protein ComEC [Xenorhabdus doucetiae]CDG17275.1 putative recombination protein with metallo-hydrolase domain [Xenorhabdus doucetiae]